MDIRQKTYEEEIREYRDDLPLALEDMEPEAFIKAHGLTPEPGPVDTDEHPVGTWFVYYEGETYVK